MKFLVLTDGKAGHENQSKAFARALGGEFDLVEVHFRSKFAKACSYLLDWLGVRTPALLTGLERDFRAAGYSAVIGTGSGTFYAAKAMAARLGVRCGVVLYPRGYSLYGFGCVMAPVFDRPLKAKNVIPLPVNLVANDEPFYERGINAFRMRCAAVADEIPLAVIVGGPNRCSTMSAEWMHHELERIFKEGRTLGPKVRFWVTTSRRTPPEVEKVVDSFPWDYRLIYSRDQFNPIPAFVKLAKRLYVTAESTGMLSECCTFGAAEVVALDNLKPGNHKFRRFVEELRQGGYVDGCRKVDLAPQFARARELLLDNALK